MLCSCPVAGRLRVEHGWGLGRMLAFQHACIGGNVGLTARMGLGEMLASQHTWVYGEMLAPQRIAEAEAGAGLAGEDGGVVGSKRLWWGWQTKTMV